MDSFIDINPFYLTVSLNDDTRYLALDTNTNMSLVSTMAKAHPFLSYDFALMIVRSPMFYDLVKNTFGEDTVTEIKIDATPSAFTMSDLSQLDLTRPN